jgi:hypothetical protein
MCCVGATDFHVLIGDNLSKLIARDDDHDGTRVNQIYGIEKRISVVFLNVPMDKSVILDRRFSTTRLRACVG